MSESLIVVPLDGSELSEKALPYAGVLGKATGARLLLLTVWEEGDRALTSNLPGQEDLFKKGMEHYGTYLIDSAGRAGDIEVETEVLIGDPAEEILNVIEQRDPHLLIMASHGRSGLSRWRYGSVADKLARAAPVATMVVGPQVLEHGRAVEAISRILVPLDGSPLGESALEPALELAEALDADLVLAQVLRWASQAFAYGVPEVDVVQVDQALTAAAEKYLAKVGQDLGAKRETKTVVLRGAPSEALIELVEAEEVDLVVMASHTRSGVARAMLGSTADRLSHGKAPVLLIRPEAVASVARARRGRYCHNCGRASPYIEVLPDDTCLRCGQHLRACANCVYFDSVTCLLQRPEVHDAYPGQNCPHFQFRETEQPKDAPHVAEHKDQK